jgi:hypothetical protein
MTGFCPVGMLIWSLHWDELAVATTALSVPAIAIGDLGGAPLARTRTRGDGNTESSQFRSDASQRRYAGLLDALDSGGEASRAPAGTFGAIPPAECLNRTGRHGSGIALWAFVTAISPSYSLQWRLHQRHVTAPVGGVIVDVLARPARPSPPAGPWCLL